MVEARRSNHASNAQNAYEVAALLDDERDAAPATTSDASFDTSDPRQRLAYLREIIRHGTVRHDVMTDLDADAKFRADVARLQAAKGIQVRAWLRENRTLGLVFLVYLAVVAASAGLFVARGERPGPAIVGAFLVAPLVLVRMYLRWNRRAR